MANWVWAQLFGKGLVDPPDDMSRANPPVHPELLDALARHFVASKFDLRDLIRTIAVSETYGLSSATVPGNERDTRLFSHQLAAPADRAPDGRRAGPGDRRPQSFSKRRRPAAPSTCPTR